jgi:hypothetical protein
MALAWLPRAATTEMVCRALVQLALAPAFTAEVHDRWRLAQSGAAAPTWRLLDAAGASEVIDSADASYATTVDQWMHDAFASAEVDDQLRLAPPFPRLHVIPSRGRALPASGGALADEAPGVGVRIWETPIECAVITQGDDPSGPQREALVLADALAHLVRRNEQLGGLVMLIKADGPPVPGGTSDVAGEGTLGAAMQRFLVRTLDP